MNWLTLAASGPRLMDGAMGTQLLPLGLPCVVMANLREGARVRAVHAAYARAGAEVHLTNTFMAHPSALAPVGLEERLEEICRSAIGHARAAVCGGLVLGDVGPAVAPGRKEEFTDREGLLRQLEALDGCDGILFETCSTPAALAAVEFAFHRTTWLEANPVLLSISYVKDGEGKVTSWSGHPPELFARHARRHGVAAIGVNCGVNMGVADCAEVLRRYAEETDLPLFARPSAGLPGSLVPVEEFTRGASGLVVAGACMVGGCCGVGPEYVEAVGKALARRG